MISHVAITIIVHWYCYNKHELQDIVLLVLAIGILKICTNINSDTFT